MNLRSLADYTLVVVFVGLVLAAPATVGIAVGGGGSNLLENPGCEAGDGTNAPVGWTNATDDQIVCNNPDPWGGPSPIEGSNSFVDGANDGGNPTIEQTVQVNGSAKYAISGWVGSFEPTDDYVRIEVDYLDASDTVLSDGQIRHDAYNDSGNNFTEFKTSSVAPSNAEKATIRIKLVNVDGGYADGIVDGLDFHQVSTAPTANDVDGLSVDIDDTLTASAHDDYGFGADDLGDPVGNVSSFGGGDLGGTVADHAANATVTLAGGDLTLNDDGSLELAAPTEAGTYSFDYRLENDVGSDDATVTITVVDNSSFAVSVVDANESVAENEAWSIGVGVENVGTNVGTQNVTLEIDDEGGTTVHQDEQELTLAAGATDTLTFEWTPGGGSAGEYEANVSSDDDNATVNVTVYELGSIEGTVVDANSKDPDQAAIEGANVTVVFPDDTEIETTTNGTGEFSVGDVPATGEEYSIEVVADGYHGNATTANVSDATPVDIGVISLDGNATISGTIRDGATGNGLAGANVTATTGIGSYETTTDADGSYTIANVSGGQEYGFTIAADGYQSNSTAGVSVGDGATHELNATLAGNATIEGAVESNASGQGIENASVTVVYPDGSVFTVENATDGTGNFSIADVPGTGESYDVVVRAAGFENATTTATVADGAVVDVGTLSLLGNATVAGTVEDETFSTGVAGVTVNVSNGNDEFTTVTDGNGSFVVEDVPGGESYTVSVDADGWETNSTTIAVDDGETVSDVTVTILGSDQLEATVYDQLLLDNSSDDGLLDGATVTIEHSSLGTVNNTTDNGTVGPVPVPGGETYNVTASKSGYDSQVRIDVSNGSNVEFVLAGNSTVDGTVTDDLSGDGLENATIVIEYPSGANATIENATNATGVYAIDGVPGTGDEYVVTASADGYVTESATTAKVHGGTVTANIELLPAGEATVSGTVTDEVTGSAIENANVTVELDDSSAPDATVVYNGTTDGDGNYTFVDVIGGYDYNVSIVADGYENASTVEPVSENGTTTIDLALAGNASISGTVVDSPFDFPLENASVTAVGSQGKYTAETDAGGSYTIDRVPGTGETYAVTVRADGYEANDTTVGLGGVDDGTDVNLTLVGNATVVLTATDGVTGQAIGVDASVTVSHATRGEVTLSTVSPDGADEYHVAVPGIGDSYNVSIDATGYDSGGTHSTGTLGSGEQTVIDETLQGSAELTGTVADDATGDPIANATVTATRGAGTYTAETAADGTYTIEQVAGTGEQYDVTATARAYEDGEKSLAVPESGATVNLDLVKRSHFFGIESVDVPDEVEEGDSFEIAATIANLGSSNWNDSVEFVVDGVVVGNESVQLANGTNATAAVGHVIDDAGTYAVQVRTANESANATLDVVAKPPSSPSSPPSSGSDDDSDEDVVYEEVGTIERDDSGRHGATFSEDAGVEWVIFDEEVEGTVTVATLADEIDETDENNGTSRPPGVGVATYRIDVPDGAENRSATIRVRVTNERMAELGVEPEDLRISRMTDDDWEIYDTAVVAEEEWGVILEARTPGFSYFAVTAVRPPEAAISIDPTAVEPGEEVTLSAAGSTSRYGEIVTYEWTVAGRTTEGETITVTFDDAGDYRIELTVTNADGEIDTATATLTIDGTTEQPVEDEPSEGDGTARDGETPTETTSDGQPGFGLLVAGIALFVGVLFVRRR